MKRVPAVLSLVLAMMAILLLTAQTTSIVRELNTEPRLRQALVNAMNQGKGVGQDAFTTIAKRDTVVIPGLRSTSRVVVTPYSSTKAALPNDSDLVQFTFEGPDSAVFTRSGGTSGLKYIWQVVLW